MNSYMEISKKYFRQNKRRSLVNIIAIILATMFISGTGHMIYSSQQNIINMIREDGDYHFKIELSEKRKFSKIKANSVVDKTTFCRKIRSVALGEKTLVINEINKEGFGLLGVRLKEGRFPKKSDEIILRLDIKEKEHKKIGDKIIVKLDNNKNTYYTIVGFSQATNRAFLKIVNAYAVNDNGIADNVEVYVKLKESRGLNNKINNLSKKFNIDPNKIEKNEALLTALGEGRSKTAIIDYITFFMVAIVVMISTFIFIYNSFNISTVERMKEYGLIKAIGGTNKEIKKIILKEIFIIGAIALPIGLLGGLLTSSVLFRAFNTLILSKSINVKTYYSFYSVLGTIIITVITLYLSAISILGKIKKISPLDCFTNRSFDVKKINTRKKNLSNKFFSIEMIIANRNIRINKGRFRTTIVSIVFSITLFITFSSLVSNIEKLPYEALPMDNYMCRNNHYFINIYNDHTDKRVIKNNSKKIKETIKEVKKIQKVKDIYIIYEGIKSYAFIPEKKSKVKGESVTIEGNKYTNLKSKIVPIDINTIDQLSPYLLRQFNDKEKMKKENGVYITQISYERDMEKLDENKYKKKDIATLKVGDEVLIDTSNLMYNNNFKSNNNTVKGAMKVKVLGLVRVILFDKQNFYDKSPIIYMPTELYNDMVKNKYNNASKDNKSNTRKKRELDRLMPPELKGFVVSYKDNINNKERANIAEVLVEKWKACNDNGKINGFSIFSEKNDKYIKFGRIFYFSVIAFISIISMANVFNIVNTNVILRSKELGLLSVVGASRKSIKKIVYLEGMLYSIIGIIYGTVIGGINSIVINMMFRRGHDIAYVYPLKETLISIVFFIVVGMLAIYFPLRKIKKQNLLKYREY